MSTDDVAPPTSGPWGPVDLSILPARVAAAVASLMADTDALCAAGPEDERLDGRQAEVVASALAAGISRLTAAKIRLLPVVEADGLWATGGATSFATWVAHQHTLQVWAARAQVRLGRVLRDHLPVTAAAAVAGDITVEHAQVLGQLTPTTGSAARSWPTPGRGRTRRSSSSRPG